VAKSIRNITGFQADGDDEGATLRLFLGELQRSTKLSLHVARLRT
jgi:hypothetical protein